MFAQRLRRWANIKPSLSQRPVFAGDDITLMNVVHVHSTWLR